MSSPSATNSHSPNSGDQNFVPFGHPASFSQRSNVLFSFSIFFNFYKNVRTRRGASTLLSANPENYCRKSGVPGIRAVTAQACLASYGPLRFRSLVRCGDITRPHPGDILTTQHLCASQRMAVCFAPCRASIHPRLRGRPQPSRLPHLYKDFGIVPEVQAFVDGHPLCVHVRHHP